MQQRLMERSLKYLPRLHPTKNFPYVSLLALGAIAFIFSLLFKLGDVITAILAMRILIQFVGQAIGLLLFHKRKGKHFFKWKMPLYPLPNYSGHRHGGNFLFLIPLNWKDDADRRVYNFNWCDCLFYKSCVQKRVSILKGDLMN